MNHDLERVGHAVTGHTTKPMTRPCSGTCGEEHDVAAMTLRTVSEDIGGRVKYSSLWLCAECDSRHMAAHPQVVTDCNQLVVSHNSPEVQHSGASVSQDIHKAGSSSVGRAGNPQGKGPNRRDEVLAAGSSPASPSIQEGRDLDSLVTWTPKEEG